VADVLLWVLLLWAEAHTGPVSRRLCNLAFIVWVCAFCGALLLPLLMAQVRWGKCDLFYFYWRLCILAFIVWVCAFNGHYSSLFYCWHRSYNLCFVLCSYKCNVAVIVCEFVPYFAGRPLLYEWVLCVCVCVNVCVSCWAKGLQVMCTVYNKSFFVCACVFYLNVLFPLITSFSNFPRNPRSVQSSTIVPE